MAQYDIPLRINKSKLKSGVWPYVTFSKGKNIMNTSSRKYKLALCT